MGGALGAIAERTRLEVRFKDGFQDELTGSLDHTVTDRRNRQHADPLPTFFGNRLVPQPHGAIRAGGQFMPYLLQKPVEPAGLDGFKRHAVDTWCAVVGLGQVIGFLEGFPFADVDIQAPETPGRFSLRLGVYPPAQVLQRDGCLCHRTPASHVVEGVTNSRVPSLPGHYPRFTTTTDPSATLASSVDFPVVRLYNLPCFRRFRGGTRRASPVA